MNRCKVKIIDGKIAIGKENVRDMVRSKKDGYYSFTLRAWDRSIEQNNTYWMWLSVIGNYLGYHKNELHEVFLDMYAPIKTIRNLEGKPVQKKIRSSEMTITQMSEYMNQIDQFASENSITLPDPEDYTTSKNTEI